MIAFASGVLRSTSAAARHIMCDTVSLRPFFSRKRSM
jgi:hypothetical protein